MVVHNNRLYRLEHDLLDSLEHHLGDNLESRLDSLHPPLDSSRKILADKSVLPEDIPRIEERLPIDLVLRHENSSWTPRLDTDGLAQQFVSWAVVPVEMVV